MARVKTLSSMMCACLLSGFVTGAESIPSPMGAAETALQFATGITTDRPAGVFIEGVGAAFRTEGAAAFTRWTVTDFFETEVASGAWPTNGVSLVLPALGPGYYELDAEGADGVRGHFAFTVVRDPATRRPPAPDSPYAMMAGGSAWPKGDPEKTNADLMRLAGQASVRKIYRWEHIEKEPGKFELVPHRDFTQTYAAAGVKVCGMIHRPPKWADTAVVVPRNLRQMYAFCRRLERELGGAMCAWEIYNEQDLPQSVGDGCWNYTAAQKASYLGFKSKNAERIVFSGALCLDVGLGYDSLWLDNDGAYYSDGLNYHTYFPLGANDKWFGEWRDLLAKYGITNWATWVTEDCTNQEGDALVERPGTPNRAHTKDQERLLAEFYAKDQVFKQMNGVSRSYFFILAAYNEREGRKDWGIYRRDGTLKPCYAAAATLTGELEGATLLGEVALPDARLKGFLYAQPDGRRTLVYWTVTDFERQVERDRTFQDAPLQDVAFALPLPKGDYRAVRLTGDRRTVSVTGTSAALVATRYPAYLTGRFVSFGIRPHSLYEGVEWRALRQLLKELGVREKPIAMTGGRGFARHYVTTDGLYDVWYADSERGGDYAVSFRDGKARDVTDVLTGKPMAMKGHFEDNDFVMGTSLRGANERAAWHWVKNQFGWWQGGPRARRADAAPVDYALARTFTVPADWKGLRVRIDFTSRGDRLLGAIVNGRYVRRHHHRFGDRTDLDVTPFVRFGEENEIVLVGNGNPTQTGTVESVRLTARPAPEKQENAKRENAK